jgi:hypothetical protein
MPFVALDTRLGWDCANGTFVPPRKAVGGKLIDRGRSLSISARYQGSLTSAAWPQSFKFDVGVGLFHSIDASTRSVGKEAAEGIYRSETLKSSLLPLPISKRLACRIVRHLVGSGAVKMAFLVDSTRSLRERMAERSVGRGAARRRSVFSVLPRPVAGPSILGRKCLFGGFSPVAFWEAPTLKIAR